MNVVLSYAMKLPYILSMFLLHHAHVYALDLCQPAQELGIFGISPWGAASAFADPTAKWLAVNSDSDQFFFKYRNVRQESVVGKLHILGNVNFIIKVNGIVAGNFTGSLGSNGYSKFPVRFVQVKKSIFSSVSIPFKVTHVSGLDICS